MGQKLGRRKGHGSFRNPPWPTQRRGLENGGSVMEAGGKGFSGRAVLGGASP